MNINKQFIIYLLVGSVNTLFSFSLYSLFLALGMHYSLAVFFSSVLGIMFNFFSTGKLVFHNSDNRRIVRFVLMYCLIYVINLGLIKFFLTLGINEYFAFLFAIPILALLSFLFMRQFVFKNQEAT